MKNFVKAIAIITLIVAMLSAFAVAEESVAVDAAPAVEAPVVTSTPEKKTEAPAPAAEEKKAEEPAPAAEEKKAEEPAPAAEEKKAEELAPAAEEKKAEEPAPAAEEQKAEEPAPAAEAQKAEEPAPAVEEKKAEKSEETVTFEGAVEIEMEDDEVFFGDTVTLKAKVSNPTGASYKLQWQVNKGGDWKDIDGETKDKYEFKVTEENAEYAYRVVVIG